MDGSSLLCTKYARFIRADAERDGSRNWSARAWSKRHACGRGRVPRGTRVCAPSKSDIGAIEGLLITLLAASPAECTGDVGLCTY